MNNTVHRLTSSIRLCTRHCNNNKTFQHVAKRTVTSKKHPERPHEYYKWNYEALPTETALDEKNPQFNVRPPEFRLPNKRGRLSKREWRQRIAELQQARLDPELERLARNRKLDLPLNEIDAEWKKEYGLYELNKLAKFYGLNRDLFNGENDVAKTWLNVSFDNLLLHRGNMLQPKNLLQAPSVNYEGDADKLYTLTITNIDGHPLDSTKEVLHWMKCNIPGSDVDSGSTMFDYLPLLPWKGTGYHRVACVLYEQSAKLEDISPNDIESLSSRTFSSPAFQTLHKCTPISFAWCQVDWDESVTENVQRLQDVSEEPVFDWEEYIEPIVEQQVLRRELNEMKYRNM